jgi:hypothetical protein
MNRNVFMDATAGQPKPAVGSYFCAERCNMKPDNKRCLCNKCADDYTSAGYVLTRTHRNDKEACEKCNWHISKEYRVTEKK